MPRDGDLATQLCGLQYVKSRLPRDLGNDWSKVGEPRERDRTSADYRNLPRLGVKKGADAHAQIMPLSPIPQQRSIVMVTQEIATRLAELCRQGQFEAAQKELFAEDAVSIEPYGTPEFPKETKGLHAIIEKGHKFQSMVEQVHGCAASAPLVAGNAIAFTLTLDVTMKGRGRMKLEELCAYEVKDGKVVS